MMIVLIMTLHIQYQREHKHTTGPGNRPTKQIIMKQIITSNSELLEILAENGINIICDDQMRMTISDEDAAKVGQVVKEFAPAAYMDYTIYQI